MPLPWLIGAAVAAATAATIKDRTTTTVEKISVLDIDKTKNLISTLQNLKQKGSINCALSLNLDGLGIGHELEKKLEELPILNSQEILEKLAPHLNDVIKPLKKEVKSLVTISKPFF